MPGTWHSHQQPSGEEETEVGRQMQAPLELALGVSGWTEEYVSQNKI